MTTRPDPPCMPPMPLPEETRYFRMLATFSPDLFLLEWDVRRCRPPLHVSFSEFWMMRFSYRLGCLVGAASSNPFLGNGDDWAIARNYLQCLLVRRAFLVWAAERRQLQEQADQERQDDQEDGGAATVAHDGDSLLHPVRHRELWAQLRQTVPELAALEASISSAGLDDIDERLDTALATLERTVGPQSGKTDPILSSKAAWFAAWRGLYCASIQRMDYLAHQKWLRQQGQEGQEGQA